MHNTYKAGDRVEFTTRGVLRVGTIEKIWTSTPRRNSKIGRIVAYVGRDINELTRVKARIVPDDSPTSYWTVSVDYIIRKLGTASQQQRNEAKVAVNNIKRKDSEKQYQRQTINYEAAKENNILHLRVGAPIEVMFRDIGWQVAIFRGFVPGSGNVRFEHRGKVRISAARYVRQSST